MNLKNMVEIDNQIGFIIVRKKDNARIGFKLSGKSNSIKRIWSKSGLAKSAFCYHTGVNFKDQSEYEIKELK